MPDTMSRRSARRVVPAPVGERSEPACKRSAQRGEAERRRQGLQWKSPAGRLERKARPRSGSPESFDVRRTRCSSITTVTTDTADIGMAKLPDISSIATASSIGATIIGAMTGRWRTSTRRVTIP